MIYNIKVKAIDYADFQVEATDEGEATKIASEKLELGTAGLEPADHYDKVDIIKVEQQKSQADLDREDEMLIDAGIMRGRAND